MTRILGIETSCDETAVAVVEDGRVILSNVVASQIDLHRQYGGVFPEMASRQHVLLIVPVVRQALEQSGLAWPDMDAVAVTYGPGLPGSLLVGLNVAKGLAWSQGVPLVGVNHIEAHIYANWLGKAGQELPPPPSFPAVCLVVSGGHTMLALMSDHGAYRIPGRCGWRGVRQGGPLAGPGLPWRTGYPGGRQDGRSAGFCLAQGLAGRQL